MYFLIDMRPLAEQWPETGDFFSSELLHAFFRNFPSDIFILWTTGEHELPEHMLFDEYANTRVLHTKISSKDLHWYTDWFSAIEIDDMIETESMKQGMMPWTSRLEAAFFCSPRPMQNESNCFTVQFVNHFSPLHFAESIPKEIQKYYNQNSYTKALERASLVVVPSQFLVQECQYFCGVPLEKLYCASVGISKDIIPIQEITKEWENLPEKYFFVRVNDITESLIALKAFELLKARFPDNTWEMVIEEPYKGALYSLYERREKIHILAPLSPKNHEQVLAKASIFIDLSSYDPIGLSVLQSMRQETPILASNYGAIPEVCKTAAEYFDPTLATDLYRAIKEYIEQPEKQEKLKIAGRERSRDPQFFIDDIAIKIMEEIKKRKAG